MTIPAPPARHGGTRIFCPMVDVAKTEISGELVMCAWPSRLNTPRAHRAYRRHWNRDHLEPFKAETDALMKFLNTGHYLGMEHVRVEITVSKGRGGDDA